MEKSEVPPITAKDLLDISKLRIGGHPLERFMMRGNLNLVEAAEQLRQRR